MVAGPGCSGWMGPLFLSMLIFVILVWIWAGVFLAVRLLLGLLLSLLRTSTAPLDGWNKHARVLVTKRLILLSKCRNVRLELRCLLNTDYFYEVLPDDRKICLFCHFLTFYILEVHDMWKYIFCGIYYHMIKYRSLCYSCRYRVGYNIKCFSLSSTTIPLHPNFNIVGSANWYLEKNNLALKRCIWT